MTQDDKQKTSQPPRQGGARAAAGFSGGRSGATGAKPKNFKKALGQLYIFMGKYRIALIVSIVLAIGGVVLQILSPHFVGDLTTEVQKGLFFFVQGAGWLPVPNGGINMSVVVRLGILVAVLAVGGVILSYAQGFIMATVTQLIIKKMRTQITKKINRMPLKYFDTASYGDILSRLTNDVDTISQSLSQSIVAFISSIALLVGVLIMMFSVNWIMAFTAVGATLLGLVLMFSIMSLSQKYFKLQQKYLAELNGQVEETYSGHNVVKAYNAGKKAVETFSGTNENLKKAVRNANFFSITMHPLMNFVGNLGYVAICVAGALLVLNGSIGVGIIVEFLIYVRLFSQPLGQLSQAGQSLQSTAAASERVFEFLGEQELSNEEDKTVKIAKVHGAVEFKNVKFGYVPDKIIIKDFSASVKPGQKVAIVGPTGAGKTTIVNLLMRFYEIDSGEILIDGENVSRYTRDNIREIFGMVLQDTWMFEGTIRENIAYNQKNVSEEQIVEACKAANLDHFIRTLPKGYETVMDDKASLSAGQKQLVTIARAFVRNAPMLILDEATSSVDTRTEILIQEAMERLTSGRTTFVIAHRLSTIKNADLILVLKDGDIIEAGAHNTLLNQNGFYADLYNSQFSEN